MSLPPVCEDCGEVTECRPSAESGRRMREGWLLDPRYVCYTCYKKFRDRLNGKAYDEWHKSCWSLDDERKA